jgi:RHS repeat-associated protein
MQDNNKKAKSKVPRFQTPKAWVTRFKPWPTRGDNLVEETNAAGTVVARYSQTQNIDEPLAMLRSSTTSFYQADGLGSVTSLSNAAGSIANTYTYDSFGKLTASTGSLVNSFQYTARESDTETGLYYYRARYYDQTSGRFLSEDPIRLDAGINFYSYVGNAPANFSDPSGQLQVCCRPAKSVTWTGLKACHCFLKLSDGTTLGGYFKPPPLLRKKINDPDDKSPKDTPSCTDVPGSECKVRQAFNNLPSVSIYLLGGTSNTVPAVVLSSAGIPFTFPPCARGSQIAEHLYPK